MKDFVSRHRISVVGTAAATSLLLALLSPHDLALPVATLLAMSPALWLGREGRRVPLAVAASLRSKEEGTP